MAGDFGVKRGHEHPKVGERANRLLVGILFIFFLLALRLGYLGLVKHEEALQKARRPQTRVRIEPALRGTIRDRYNLPLAVNRVQYNVSISYGEIQQLPRFVWEAKEGGGRQKTWVRREHIEGLAHLLSEELGRNPEEIEDLIYGKAAQLPHLPFCIASGISEEQYCRLKILERDWLGLVLEIVPQRSYPMGRVASDLLGYMGAISATEYDRVSRELRELNALLAEAERGDPISLPNGMNSLEEVDLRRRELKERSYSLRDSVGKAGIEGFYEEQLKGYSGRRVYQQDIYGHAVKELPTGKVPISGERLLLTISAELQAYCEELLTQDEALREGASFSFNRETQRRSQLKQPWIKGGAIVAFDPKKGEVLALASYPRIDPNELSPSASGEGGVERMRRVRRWLELEGHIADIWDGYVDLARERFDPFRGIFYDEALELSWENYLDRLFSNSNPLRTKLLEMTIGGAYHFDWLCEQFQRASGQTMRTLLTPQEKGQPAWWNEECASLYKELSPYLNGLELLYDRLLLLDLVRLVVDRRRWSAPLLSSLAQESIATQRQAERDYLLLLEMVKERAKHWFHLGPFATWRKEEGEAFLKEKREEEKEVGKRNASYIDYFLREEREQFARFWEESSPALLLYFLTGSVVEEGSFSSPCFSLFDLYRRELAGGAHAGEKWHPAYCRLRDRLLALPGEQRLPYLSTFRCYQELDRPLFGNYRYLRRKQGGQQEQVLAGAFYPQRGFGYGRSYAYRQAAPQGSVFKLIPSYEALLQLHDDQAGGRFSSLNPLVIIDQVHRSKENPGKWNVGMTEGGQPIPQRYKGGSLLRTNRRNGGRIDLPGALEISSNSYFGLLAADHIENPKDLLDAASVFGYGQPTGIALPGEYGGHLPTDLEENRTGLYSYVNGQHTLTCTPLQTAVMLASIANGGALLKPQILRLSVGQSPLQGAERLRSSAHEKCAKLLYSLGCDLPLWTAAAGTQTEGKIAASTPEICRHLRLPREVHLPLLEGMKRVVLGERGGARLGLISGGHSPPELRAAYRRLRHRIIGKTGTAEAVEWVDLDSSQGVNIYNHIWFGAICYAEEEELTSSPPSSIREPDLVVAVYLRYGGYGRDAVPLAAAVYDRWCEIRKLREMSSL